MRIVLDTNIIVSGLISRNGAPGQVLWAWLESEFILLTTIEQLKELHRVLQYRHIEKVLRPNQVASFLQNIDSRAILLDSLPDVRLSPDPDDNQILAIAIAGKAHFLVTGDKRHLLFLKEAEGNFYYHSAGRSGNLIWTKNRLILHWLYYHVVI